MKPSLLTESRTCPDNTFDPLLIKGGYFLEKALYSLAMPIMAAP